ncbi:MAG: hypothetical protein V3T17_14100 [Pseudomonadales bacterium]
MTMLICFFGVLLVLAGFFLIINPDFFFGFLNKNVDKLWVYIGAVIVRIIFGGLLIYSSHLSKFPLAISILGWMILMVAVILLVIGRKKFEKLVLWVISVFKPYGRIGGLFSVGFGSLLIYAFI